MTLDFGRVLLFSILNYEIDSETQHFSFSEQLVRTIIVFHATICLSAGYPGSQVAMCATFKHISASPNIGVALFCISASQRQPFQAFELAGVS
jgi:hypothetical protein